MTAPGPHPPGDDHGGGAQGGQQEGPQEGPQGNHHLDPRQGASYATAAGKKGRKKLNILDIVLDRSDKQVSFNLSKDELGKLLFKRMKIQPNQILKIDTSGYGKISVELASQLNPEDYGNQPAFDIRNGLKVKYYKPHHRKDVLVYINWLDIETPDELLVHTLSHFGKVKSNVMWVKMREESDESEFAKMLNSIPNGDRQVWMEIVTPLPSYAMIDNRKVKIHHAGQKRTCARCHMGTNDCRGNSNAKLCEENGGQKAILKDTWKAVLESVNYTAWNGGELADTAVVEAETEENEEEDVEIHDNCDGVVLTNIKENSTKEDIQELLKGIIDDDALDKISVHPTGSFTRKVVKDITRENVAKIIKGTNKKIHNGKTVYCQQNVKVTPEKPVKTDETQVENENLERSKTVESTATPSDTGNKPRTIPTGTRNRNIPGLPEEEIKKSRDKQRRKEEKAKKKAMEAGKAQNKSLNNEFPPLMAGVDLNDYKFDDDDVFDKTIQQKIDEKIGTPKHFKSIYAELMNSPGGIKRGSEAAALSPPNLDLAKMFKPLKDPKEMKSGLPVKN